MPKIELTFKRIQVFYWKEPDGAEHRWSVDAAMQLIMREKLLPEIEIRLQDATDCLYKNDDAKQFIAEVNEHHDCDEPVILITHYDRFEKQDSNILIDGWHRLAKMVKTNRMKPMTAYVLNQKQANEIKLI
jgi:hypothetical protein